MQLQLKLTTQEIDFLKKLKDVHSPDKKPISNPSPNVENEEEKKEESIFARSILGVSSIHELQSILDVLTFLFS